MFDELAYSNTQATSANTEEKRGKQRSQCEKQLYIWKEIVYNRDKSADFFLEASTAIPTPGYWTALGRTGLFSSFEMVSFKASSYHIFLEGVVFFLVQLFLAGVCLSFLKSGNVFFLFCVLRLVGSLLHVHLALMGHTHLRYLLVWNDSMDFGWFWEVYRAPGEFDPFPFCIMSNYFQSFRLLISGSGHNTWPHEVAFALDWVPNSALWCTITKKTRENPPAKSQLKMYDFKLQQKASTNS